MREEITMKRFTVTATALLLAGLGALWHLPQASGQADAGWVTLLDSSKMGDWNQIGDANWRMVDGAVVADKKESKDSAFLVSKNSYKDFQMRVEFWADDDANSGVFIRCSDPQKITATNSYEVNIFDKRPDPSYGTGAIVNFAKVDPMPKAGGKWNTFEITAKGPQLIVVLNGTKTVDIQDSKFASGPFGLQYAAGVIKFRKVQIKPL
jgi:3-keto-disaccharide hydrolase